MILRRTRDHKIYTDNLHSLSELWHFVTMNHCPTYLELQPSPEEVEVAYLKLKRAQQKFGMARLEIGYLLQEIKERDLWAGKSHSFTAFLDEERIPGHAAYQYMRVAKKLFLELQISQEELRLVANVNMSILDKACSTLNAENKDQILDLITNLGRRDAKVALAEFKDMQKPDGAASKVSQPVNAILDRFKELNDDQRLELLSLLKFSPSRGG